MSEVKLYKPRHADSFETLVKKCLEVKKGEDFFPYGVNGQKQYGIDLINCNRSVAVQCKHYSKPGSFKADVQRDFLEAITEFPDRDKICTFIVATSLSRDTGLQDFLTALMANPKNTRNIEVVGYFWEDLEEIILAAPHLRKYYEPFLIGSNSSNTNDTEA